MTPTWYGMPYITLIAVHSVPLSISPRSLHGVPAAITLEAREDVLAGRGMAAAVLVANMCLYAGDESILIVAGDDCMTTWAGQAEDHKVSSHTTSR